MNTQTNLALKGETYSLENLIEEISENLGGIISDERIAQVVAEIAVEFQDATVISFVPIFIQRYAHERLGREIQRKGAR